MVTVLAEINTFSHTNADLYWIVNILESHIKEQRLSWVMVLDDFLCSWCKCKLKSCSCIIHKKRNHNIYCIRTIVIMITFFDPNLNVRWCDNELHSPSRIPYHYSCNKIWILWNEKQSTILQNRALYPYRRVSAIEILHRFLVVAVIKIVV